MLLEIIIEADNVRLIMKTLTKGQIHSNLTLINEEENQKKKND